MPFIGITCDFETIRDARGALAPRFFSPAQYSQTVVACGGTPLILPHSNFTTEKIAKIIARLDGLLITGGNFDLPPEFYGETPKPGLGKLNTERSTFEKALCLKASERDLPILGICGGMQLLNVVCGGTLYQDLGQRPETQNHVQTHPKQKPAHQVRLTPNSRLAAICKASELEVNSTHHQAVFKLGKDVRVVAEAPDGVVEAIEISGFSFALGVQWHPEALDSPAAQSIYQTFIDCCKNRLNLQA